MVRRRSLRRPTANQSEAKTLEVVADDLPYPVVIDRSEAVGGAESGRTRGKSRPVARPRVGWGGLAVFSDEKR